MKTMIISRFRINPWWRSVWRQERWGRRWCDRPKTHYCHFVVETSLVCGRIITGGQIGALTRVMMTMMTMVTMMLMNMVLMIDYDMCGFHENSECVHFCLSGFGVFMGLNRILLIFNTKIWYWWMAFENLYFIFSLRMTMAIISQITSISKIWQLIFSSSIIILECHFPNWVFQSKSINIKYWFPMTRDRFTLILKLGKSFLTNFQRTWRLKRGGLRVIGSFGH